MKKAQLSTPRRGTYGWSEYARELAEDLEEAKRPRMSRTAELRKGANGRRRKGRELNDELNSEGHLFPPQPPSQHKKK